MKARTLFALIIATLVLGSCSILDLSDNAQHKHLRKVAVDTPDPVINKTNIEKDEVAETIDLSGSEETKIDLKKNSGISEDAAETIEKKADQRKHIFKKPVKLLPSFSTITKICGKFAPEKDNAIDPVTILIWALIAVLILALLAVIIPDILDIIIGLLIVVLIVVLILYLAANL